MTDNQRARAQREMSALAGEAVRLEKIGSTLYAFGSELATLRLFARYNSSGAIHNPKVRIGFSEGAPGFYFSIQM